MAPRPRSLERLDPPNWMAGASGNGPYQRITLKNLRPSTTLALSIERSPDLPAAVLASVGRSAGQGGDDGFSDGRQRRLRRAGRDSFFPRSRRRGEDAGGRRRRSWPSAHGDEDLAMSGLRSGRGRVLP